MPRDARIRNAITVSSAENSASARRRAADADFLGSVLDFVLMDDAWVIAFCDASDLRYEQVMAARQVLPGGAQVHWT